MKIYAILLLCFLMLLCVSCKEFFDTPISKKGDLWGLRSVEHKQSVIFKESYTEIEIPYKARVSSMRYELRLYFPSNKTFKNDSIFKTQKAEFLTTLEGIEAQIIDESTGEVLKSGTIKSLQDLRINNSPEAPFSVWLFSKASLEKGKNYNVRLKIPPARQYNKNYQDVLLILGIGSTPML